MKTELIPSNHFIPAIGSQEPQNLVIYAALTDLLEEWSFWIAEKDPGTNLLYGIIVTNKGEVHLGGYYETELSKLTVMGKPRISFDYQFKTMTLDRLMETLKLKTSG